MGQAPLGIEEILARIDAAGTERVINANYVPQNDVADKLMELNHFNKDIAWAIDPVYRLRLAQACGVPVQQVQACDAGWDYDVVRVNKLEDEVRVEEQIRDVSGLGKVLLAEEVFKRGRIEVNFKTPEGYRVKIYLYQQKHEFVVPKNISPVLMEGIKKYLIEEAHWTPEKE